MNKPADDFLSLRLYLCEVTEFLAQYSWIYEARNTDVFVKNVLEKIPVEWYESLSGIELDELKKIPFDLCEQEFPSSFQHFLCTANRLAKFRYDRRLLVDSDEHVVIPDFIKSNTSAQKLAEIKQLTAAIGDLMKKQSFHKVIDIGSGLGYLDQLLHHNFGVSTIGFESDPQISNNAKSRTKNHCSESMLHVNSKIENTSECLALVESKLREVPAMARCGCSKQEDSENWDDSNERIMMVGLHSCGDLMPDMMKLFSKLSQVQTFLGVSCCYHHMSLKDFPMSQMGRDSLTFTKQVYPGWWPCITGLRLGCQTTRAHYAKLSADKHFHRERSLFYRAMLQVFLEKEKLVWVKPRRHLIRKSDVSCFDKFMPYIFQGMPWHGVEKDLKMKEFERLCSEKMHFIQHIKILNLLQTLLQPLWEGLVIADRMAYFMENSIKAELYLMCDELVTPRNLMLYAVK